MKRKEDLWEIRRLIYVNKFAREPQREYQRKGMNKMYTWNCRYLNRIKNKMYMESGIMTARTNSHQQSNQLPDFYNNIQCLEVGNKNLKWGISNDILLLKKKIANCLRSFDNSEKEYKVLIK